MRKIIGQIVRSDCGNILVFFTNWAIGTPFWAIKNTRQLNSRDDFEFVYTFFYLFVSCDN